MHTFQLIESFLVGKIEDADLNFSSFQGFEIKLRLNLKKNWFVIKFLACEPLY